MIFSGHRVEAWGSGSWPSGMSCVGGSSVRSESPDAFCDDAVVLRPRNTHPTPNETRNTAFFEREPKLPPPLPTKIPWENAQRAFLGGSGETMAERDNHPQKTQHAYAHGERPSTRRLSVPQSRNLSSSIYGRRLIRFFKARVWLVIFGAMILLGGALTAIGAESIALD